MLSLAVVQSFYSYLHSYVKNHTDHFCPRSALILWQWYDHFILTYIVILTFYFCVGYKL
jgi:hypothetical protein